MKQRRLLTIAHSYVVAMNRRLVREMARAGGERWEVVAVTPNLFHGRGDLRTVRFEKSEDETSCVEVVPAYLTKFVHLFGYGRELRNILRKGWDLVHVWEEPYIRAGWQIARWTPANVPLVYRSAQSISKNYPPPFNFFERYDMNRAAGWICSGNLVAECLKSRAIYQDRPMRLIPLGVDVDVFKPNFSAAREVLRKLDWEIDGPPIVGFLGRLVAEKGIDLLLRALDGVRVPWRAMFVGAGPMLGNLRAFALRYGDRVRLCTDVHHDAVSGYLAAMNVMCAPSQTTPTWREQFGRMLIEAFATGAAVIGSDSGEIPFVVADAGVICGERDLPAWIAAIESLLSDPGRRNDLAQRGIERAHRLYAWPIVGKAHVEFFESLLDGR